MGKHGKKNVFKKLFILFTTLIIISLGTFYGITLYKEGKNKRLESLKQKQAQEEKIRKAEEERKKKEEEENREKKISLIAGGDCLIHNSVYEAARVKGGFDFKPMLENIKPIVQKHDLAYYNQETILAGDELPLSNYPMFCSPTQVGDAFIDAGFNIVSLANNHTLDKGSKGVDASMRYWNKKKDQVMFHGSASSEEEANKIDIREKNGIKYTMLSYREEALSNGLYPKRPYEVNIYSKERAKKQIERVRDKVDVVIVAIHWGWENRSDISPNQKKIAKELSEMGVDIILGNHSHIIQPIERINKTVVVYSMGNFISSQFPTDNLIGGLTSMDIKLKKGELTVDNIETKLMFTKKSNKFKLIPFDKLTNNDLPGKDVYFNKYSKILTSLLSDVKVVK